jgi:hypothetical protein
MRATVYVVFALVMAVSTAPANAQFGFGGKSLVLNRSLPPAVTLDAKSFHITASSQESSGRDVAASFRELFRAKVQGDERFVYTDVNPALRMSIVVTRFYIEPKTLPGKRGQCVTNLGNLQGTFSVIDSESGRPYASDTVGWKLQTTETRHVLVSDEGDIVGVEGPQDKLSPAEVWTTTATSKSPLSKIPGFGEKSHPCDNPFTSNEARDALADAFMTEIVRLATPYTVDVQVPVPNDRVLRNAVEEIQADRWSQAVDALLGTKEQQDADTEAARLYLLGIAYEGLGYKQGTQAFDISKKIQPRLAADQLAQYQKELARVVDLAKDYFDKASLSFSNANKRNDKDEYRAGERRADQSRQLYARIQRYRDLKPEAPAAAAALRLTMAEIVDNCRRNMAPEIIIDQIVNADELLATRAQAGQLVDCGDKQTPIFNALRKRWDATAKPAAPATPPASPTGSKPPASPPGSKPPAPARGAKPPATK